jgi:hypothetical protein
MLLTKYYYDYEIKKNEVGGVCSTDMEIILEFATSKTKA